MLALYVPSFLEQAASEPVYETIQLHDRQEDLEVKENEAYLSLSRINMKDNQAYATHGPINIRKT